MGLKSAFDQVLNSPLEEQLPALDALIWQSLLAGSKSPKHPWNLAAISTVTMPAALPTTRTVVLRGAAGGQRQLQCYSDTRAGKVSDLAENPATCWLFYVDSTRIQLRLSGSSKVIEEGAEVDEAWGDTSLLSRSAYLSRLPPAIGKPDRPFDVSDRLVDELEQSERGRENFCIIQTQVTSADWLYLRREGHLRARFLYSETNTQCEWVNP